MGVVIVISETYLNQLSELAISNNSALIVDKSVRWALKKEFEQLGNIHWFDEQYFLWVTRINSVYLISLRFLIKKEVIGKDVNGDDEIVFTLVAIGRRELND